MKLATGEINWEQAAIEASKDSWKDELTVCFIIIVAGNFIPGIQPFMAQVLKIWLKRQRDQWAIYASIAASFGIRTMRGFGNNGNVAMDNAF